MAENKRFVSIVSRYYKYNEALLVLDHVTANRKGITASDNVNSEHSHKNIGVVTRGCKSPVEALEKACERYKKVTGRKPRSDFNVLFDHVVVLSEAHYSYLERKLGEEKAKKRVLAHMIAYAKRIKREYGFEPISVQLHLCEGHEDLNGNFIRNIHGHVSFYNYDFKKKIAPLRHLMKKGKNIKGRTNSSNPHFEKFQTIVAQEFSELGFQRGLSKNVTGVKHLEKEAFVREKLAEREVALVSANNKVNELNDEIINHQKRTDLLSDEIQKLQNKHDWLSAKVDELHSYFLRLDQALRSRCQNAIMQIQSKAKRLLVSNKPSL
jgi:hypothetical protein